MSSSNFKNKIKITHFEITYFGISNNYEEIRKRYEELNKLYIEAKSEINKLKIANENYDDLTTIKDIDLKKENYQLKEQIRFLKENFNKEKESEINRLKGELNEKTNILNTLKKDKDLKEKELGELKRKIDESFSSLHSKSLLSFQINDITDSVTLKSSYSQLNEHFICKKCKKVPIIKFETLNTLQYNCLCAEDCKTIEKILIENITKDGEDKSEKDICYEDYLKCSEHKQNYIYYCKIDKVNLCRKCIWEKSYHQDHTLFFFDLHYFEIYEIKKQIDNILNGKKQDNFDINTLDPIEYIIHLLSVIFNDFREYPNYSHIVFFRDARKFFHDFISNENNNQIIEDYKLKKEIKVTNKNQLLLDNNINPEIIGEIDISRSFLNSNDIKKICEFNLINLRILRLHENCIQNIEPLKHAKFKDLESLDLSHNKLRDNSIPILSQLQFNKLKELNLYLNDITDSNIFQFNNEKCMPNLETFYIGSNIINWDINNNKDKKIKYDLSSLKLIGLTNGIFDKKTVSLYIGRFIFTNLEILYINRNDFISLEFVKDLDLPSIKRFHMHNSLIKDYSPLVKYKNLEKIELRENLINNIDNLRQFCDNFKYLKELNLKDNKIDNNEKNKKIIELIEKEKQKLNIII